MVILVQSGPEWALKIFNGNTCLVKKYSASFSVQSQRSVFRWPRTSHPLTGSCGNGVSLTLQWCTSRSSRKTGKAVSVLELYVDDVMISPRLTATLTRINAILIFSRLLVYHWSTGGPCQKQPAESHVPALEFNHRTNVNYVTMDVLGWFWTHIGEVLLGGLFSPPGLSDTLWFRTFLGRMERQSQSTFSFVFESTWTMWWYVLKTTWWVSKPFGHIGGLSKWSCFQHQVLVTDSSLERF